MKADFAASLCFQKCYESPVLLFSVSKQQHQVPSAKCQVPDLPQKGKQIVNSSSNLDLAGFQERCKAMIRYCYAAVR